MKKYLLDKKEDIRQLKVENRLIEFPFTKNFILSIIGPRRAGKTYSLYNFILNQKKLKDEDFIFLNFEDEELRERKREEITKVISFHYELYGKEPSFIFFDEIQTFEGWERFVYSLFEKKRYFIFITGSSSKLLSKEIATQLRGRTFSVLVLPFSFREILALKKIKPKPVFSTREENKIKNLLRVYLQGGGFPDVVLININKRVFFRDYIDLVVFRDVVERFGIKEPYLVKLLINHMLASFSKELSINKVFNTFKSKGIKVSKKTLYGYAYALEEVMFCFLLRKFFFSPRKTMLSIPKVYFNDTGLINYSLLSRLETDIGRLMENLVFLELKRAESKGEISAIFYWKDYQGKEVDFVLKEGLKIKQLIQVTYISSFDEIRKQEIKGLIKASEQLKCKDLLVITWDYEDEVKISNKKIKFIPLWKWLLKA